MTRHDCWGWSGEAGHDPAAPAWKASTLPAAPERLESRRRVERALVAVVQEAYVQGISTLVRRLWLPWLFEPEKYGWLARPLREVRR